MGSRRARQYYCRCGTRLAKDNPGRQCARCEHASRDKLIAPPEVPAEFWQTEQFREAFAVQHMGRVARAYRTHPYHYAVYGPSGISQTLLGQWLGMRQPHVSRFETGPPIRDLDTLVYWARVLRIPAGLLWFDMPGQTRQQVVPSRSAASLDATGAIVNGRPVLVPIGGDIDATGWDAMSPLNRRSVLSYGLATAAASALSPHEASRALHGNTAPLGLSLSPQASWATATYEAVLNPLDAARHTIASSEEGGRDPHALRPVINRAMRVSLSSDYGALEQSLPSLIGQAEAAATHVGVNDRAAQQALSDVYAVVGWTLIKADSSVGAWIAAQRALQAAEQADDVLRVAAATRCLAEVHMRAKNFEEATRTALVAAVSLESAAPEHRLTALSIRGAALLSAAAASARRGDSREAHAALKSAAACAAEVGDDRSDLATVFGPTNVAIHQVAIPLELGDAHSAVRHIPAVQLDRMPKALTERRSRFLIDVARSYAQKRDDSAAIDALIQAETIAADELRYHRLTRELVPQLLAREHRTSDLRALADRCNLLA